MRDGQFDWGGRLPNRTGGREGLLRLVGNQPVSAMAKASLTARGTPRAETKVGHSDPVAPHGRAIAHG